MPFCRAAQLTAGVPLRQAFVERRVPVPARLIGGGELSLTLTLLGRSSAATPPPATTQEVVPPVRTLLFASAVAESRGAVGAG